MSTGQLVGRDVNFDVTSRSILAAGATSARTLADHFGDRVNVRDFGAKGDGATDDYAAIQAAVARINALGGGTLLFPTGVYKVNRYRIDAGPQVNGVTDFIINGVDGLTIEGCGSKLDMLGLYTRSNDSVGTSYRNTVGFQVRNSNRVTIRDLEIDGNNDDTTKVATVEGFTHALSIVGCTDVHIQNVQGHHYPSDGLYVSEGGSGPIYTGSQRVSAINCHFHHNGRQGMTITVLRGGSFVNCTFSDQGRSAYGGHAPQSGVDIEPTRSALAGTADENTGDIDFTGCTFSNNVGSEFIVSGAEVSTVYPFTMTGCRFIGGVAGSNEPRVTIGAKQTTMVACYFKDVELKPGYALGNTLKMHLTVTDSLFENDRPGQRMLLWEMIGESSLTMLRNRFIGTAATAFTPAYRIWALSSTSSVLRFADNRLWFAATEHNGAGVMNLANFQSSGGTYERNEWNTDLGAGTDYWRIQYGTATVSAEKYLGTVGAFSPSTGRTTTLFSQGRVATGLLELGDGTSTYSISRTHRYGTAAPVSGTFVAGDVVWNSAPSATSPLGWRCTVGGTPGTWVAMAQGSAQTDSVAADVATLKTDFNGLLAKLRAVGLIAT